MRVELVRIGNSRGIRIPQSLIEQCGFGDAVELHVENNRLIISPERRPRQNWAETFQAAGSTERASQPLDDTLPNAFDQNEWQW